MKTKIFILLFVFCCILTGCGDTSVAEKEKRKSIDASNSEKEEQLEIAQKIVFVYQRKNWADGYQNYGYYIDNSGNKAEYDVSGEDEKYADIAELVSFLENRADLESEPYLEKNELNRYYKWLMRISDDYHLEERSSGSADVGSYCYYGIRYDDDGKIAPVLLSKDGDWIAVNSDHYAQKLAEELRK